MHIKSFFAASLLVVGIGTSATPAVAASFDDPNWPCVQRKVVRLSMGQMWTAELPPEDADWRGDAGVASLVQVLAARRTTLEEADAHISVYSEGAADRQLVLLFAGLFQRIGRERSRIIEGIVNYAAKQNGLATKIDAQRDEIVRMLRDVRDDDYDVLDKIDELQDALDWDIRIHDERRKSLNYVCESPVLLEKRLFALSRMIQARLRSP